MLKVLNKDPKKEDKKPAKKKRIFNPDVLPIKAKVYSTSIHRTLRGTRKS
jgi:hypothetical protein